jgi:hypothetical protein
MHFKCNLCRYARVRALPAHTRAALALAKRLGAAAVKLAAWRYDCRAKPTSLTL